jgi:hypothetical protein
MWLYFNGVRVKLHSRPNDGDEEGKKNWGTGV